MDSTEISLISLLAIYAELIYLQSMSQLAHGNSRFAHIEMHGSEELSQPMFAWLAVVGDAVEVTLNGDSSSVSVRRDGELRIFDLGGSEHTVFTAATRGDLRLGSMFLGQKPPV